MLPDFVNIGAMRCGTSSLHHILGLHPELLVTRRKEPDFLVSELNWPRGLAWYEAQFPAGEGLRGDVSPNYAKYPLYSGIPQRLRKLNAEARIIYLVRDPVERIVSHYVHHVAVGYENQPFEQATDPSKTNPYIDPSRYAVQLAQYLDHFPRGQVLIVPRSQFLHRRREAVAAVFAFLGVEPGFWSSSFESVRNQSRMMRRKTALGRLLDPRPARGAGRRPLNDLGYWVERVMTYPLSRRVLRPKAGVSHRRRLLDVLGADIERFEAMTDMSFPDWKI